MTLGKVGAWLSTLMAGSLLKRTLVSVGAFVLGSAAFVTVVSLVLVSVARGVFPQHGTSSSSSSEADTTSAGTKSGSKVTKSKKGRAGSDETPAKANSDDSNKDE